jgi:hypothetical protein
LPEASRDCDDERIWIPANGNLNTGSFSSDFLIQLTQWNRESRIARVQDESDIVDVQTFLDRHMIERE